MGAGNAVGKLLDAAEAQDFAGEGAAHPLGAGEVVQQGGEHVHTHGELARLLEPEVDILAHQIGAGARHGGHITHAGDALGVELFYKGPVGAAGFGLGESEHFGQRFVRGGLVQKAGELAVFVLAVAAALGGDGIGGEPQTFQTLAVEPQGVQVAAGHGDGAVGVYGVQALFAGLAGIGPQGVVPAVAHQPFLFGAYGGQGGERIHTVLLAAALAEDHIGAVVDGGEEKVQMGIVKARGEHAAAQVQHAGVGAFEGPGPFDGAHVHDLAARYGHGAGKGFLAGGGEDGGAFEDQICLHVQNLALA